MGQPEPSRLFQGNELPRLLFLLAIVLVGWGLVWHFAVAPKDRPEPGPVIDGPPTAIVPDRSPEFESVNDKTALSFRDMSAYARLIGQTRADDPAVLDAKARRDVFLAHLWDNPAHYRGVPIHLTGTARRVLYYESKLSRSGWLYEAWVFSGTSRVPYVCVFEDAPRGFPVGEDISERVAFNGYFLKLMKYNASDVARASPLLVGRIGWTPTAPPNTSGRGSVYWLAGGVAVLFLISLGRWAFSLRRSLAPRARPSLLRDRPTEEIDPEALSAWLETVSEAEGEEPRG